MTVEHSWPGLASPGDNNVDMPILDKSQIKALTRTSKSGVNTFNYMFGAPTPQGNMELFSNHQLFRGPYPMKRLVLGLNIPTIRLDSEIGYDVADPQHAQIQIVATVPSAYWLTPAVLKKMIMNTNGLLYGSITAGDPATDYLAAWYAGLPLFA